MLSNRTLGAILLIIGTCIGAGMLALPVATASYGFWPTTVLFTICWGFLAFTALLILEVNLWLAPGTNLISMAKQTLGKTGQIIAWLAYLLLLYALMAAYLSGMNGLLDKTMQTTFNFTLHHWLGTLLLIVLFGIIIYLGATTIDYLNRLLFLGLVIAYLLLIGLISPHISLTKLAGVSFNKLWLALPIVTTSFGFHIIIPSLRTYLRDDVKKLRLVVIIGSAIPLIIYLIWEFLILGIVPKSGPESLMAIYQSGQPAIGLSKALDSLLNSSSISVIFKFFAFFAISTSFIGVSYSLFDFLADGFQIKKTKLGRLSTALITFIPPLLFAIFYPRGFILALGFAGVFVAILLGILPTTMAWSGRYKQRMPSRYMVWGGKFPLILATLFFVFVILVEFAIKYF